MRDLRVFIVAGVVGAAVVLFLVLRPGDHDDPAAPAERSAQATAPVGTEPDDVPETTEPAETATEPEPEPEPPSAEAETIVVLVRGGQPEGGIQRVSVARDTDVRLVVRADVTDHVHLHGYDVMRDVAPGAPAQLRFRATIPGRFEVELENAGLQIAEIEVGA